ncbi:MULTISPECIES: ABC transporter permease subunit [unclassified Actinomyces]|uniref:ABC transporter permease n=1 Tax=unclassified Actinomyces TaxID=2609248 RepID=UPI002017C7A5|nr:MULTISPECIES: ABC transporter permease subunit [unclassified Actinomyces]MCL3777131.1 sugar ABC transporter permease [Actinomyces sp. AC-20-1]MCL3788953.1 sugar ABC transporter permease [Actinomyces sp. 187325]MCL3791317.1 sugar ABC transporter permease [Actinomyces sp. 186855]MCL3794148.1 sugar ABC transporter permease [Actinomyces sp. 217892]
MPLSTEVTRTRPPAAPRRRRGLADHVKRYWQLWLMVMPALVFVAVFSYVPMYGIQLAFKELDFQAGLTGGDFVGLRYFRQFFDSPMFTTLMRNTVLIAVSTLVLGFIAPILLALLINQVMRSSVKRWIQTITYLPHFISVVVIVGMLQVFLSPSDGLLTRLLAALGVTGVNFLGDTRAFVPVYVLSDVWQHVGWNSIIYLAALAGVNTQLYEAARIDGANRWQLIRHVDIPALVPTMIILLILNMGNVLNTGFEKVFLMQNTLNLPVSEVISTYTYKIGILSSQFSYSTAIGLFNTVINFTFLVVANRIAKKVTDTSLF